MKREPLTVQVRALTAWFDIHHNDATVPQEYFRQQLRFNKNILGPKSERQNSRFRNCLPPERTVSFGSRKFIFKYLAGI